MKHLNEFKTHTEELPWDALTKVAKKFMKMDPGVFGWYQDLLVDKDSEFDWHGIKDRFIIPLANKGIVKKGLTVKNRMYFVFNLFIEVRRSNRIDLKLDMIDKYGFETWYETAKIKVYRGVPSEMKMNSRGVWVPKFTETEITHSMKSFSLLKDYAQKFTNRRWVGGAFAPDTKGQNGWLYTGEITPQQIYIYNEEGGEQEIIPTDVKIVKIEKIVNGKVI